jgi:UDP-N-acetylmuramoyl-tripeptide--D-alanyl-D-alanine ligase
VKDSLGTLQALANYHRRQLQIPFIAITGSNGKTTTKELVTTVLRQKFITYATEGNLNNHIGVPLTLLKIKQDAEIAVVEMGANHLGEIASYCKIALPTHGIITNCGKAHIEGFGSLEGVRKAKGELYDFIREQRATIFRNTELLYLEEMSRGIEQQVTYGDKEATYIGEAAKNGMLLDVILDKQDTIIHTQLVGDYNFPNVMAAVAVGQHFGVAINEIKEAIETYSPDNSRSQWLQAGNNNIILDAYNANPSSMRAAISNFAAADMPRKTLWLGAMKEMGPEEKTEHEAMVRFIEQYDWHEVILTGKEFAGIETNFKLFESSASAAEYVKANRPSGSTILIKGSRGSKMELMLESLK